MPLRLTGLSSGMDTDSIIKDLMKAQRTKSTSMENKLTTLKWKQEKWSSLNTKLYSFYVGPLAKMRMEGSFKTKDITSSDATKVDVTAGVSVPNGNHTVEVKAVASAQFVTGAKLEATTSGGKISGSTKLKDLGFKISDDSTIVINSGGKDTSLKVGEDTTIDNFLESCRTAGLNASYDTNQKRFFISSKTSGYENAFSMSCRSQSLEPKNSMNLLGLSEITKTTNADKSVTVTGGSNISLVQPSDAVVIYNGAKIQSATNKITVNDMIITVKEVTKPDEKVNISVSTNTQAVYDNVKNFIKSYNELLKELNSVYYADAAKGYEPLTDEQKEAMTDDQVEIWENKIKTSLLRRDNTVSDVMSSFSSMVNKNITIDGKNFALSSFGIEAVDYTEKGLLHIKGDSEDPLTMGSENKLMKALQEDPDKVMEVFNTIADKLYSDMTEKMKSSTLKSALTFYNDKEMKKTITNYETNLSDMEAKLVEKENRYYKQFAAMEAALSKLDSQSQSLTAMLGTSAN